MVSAGKYVRCSLHGQPRRKRGLGLKHLVNENLRPYEIESLVRISSELPQSTPDSRSSRPASQPHLEVPMPVKPAKMIFSALLVTSLGLFAMPVHAGGVGDKAQGKANEMHDMGSGAANAVEEKHEE